MTAKDCAFQTNKNHKSHYIRNIMLPSNLLINYQKRSRSDKKTTENALWKTKVANIGHLANFYNMLSMKMYKLVRLSPESI